MLTNYLKLAFRLLLRNPSFTAINVVGLSCAFAVFVILWQYTQHELSSDRYHRDADRIVRMSTDWRWTDDGRTWGQLYFGQNASGIAYQAAADNTAVEGLIRIAPQYLFSVESVGHSPIVELAWNDNGKVRRFKETRAAYADPGLLQFFTIPMIAGDPASALKEMNSVVLSRSTATKYFGKNDPVGELLVLNETKTLKVTGVFEDLPGNTHLGFDLVISNRGHEKFWNTGTGAFVMNYFKVRPGVATDSLEAKINNRMDVYAAEIFRTLPHVKMKAMLQPLTGIVFAEDYIDYAAVGKSKVALNVLTIVSVVILLMGWANYVNLTVSRTRKRLKEIATRKMTGALSTDFALQFVIEASLINAISVLLAATFVQFVREPVSIFLEMPVEGFTAMSWDMIVTFGGVVLAGILVTGLYPAVVCASFSPRVLFSWHHRPEGKSLLPAILTTAQYVAAIVLISSGLIIHRQLMFILTKDLGFDRDHVLVIGSPLMSSESLYSGIDRLSLDISSIANVAGVTSTSAFINLSCRPEGSSIYINTDGYGVDEQYLPLLEIPLLAGRNFVRDDRADVAILTRFAAERMGFLNPEEAIGAKFNAGPVDKDWHMLEIIGVTENIKSTAFYNQPDNTESQTGRGLTFLYRNKAYSQYAAQSILVKLKSYSKETIAAVEEAFHSQFPESVFASTFLDDQINSAYNREKRMRNQLATFTVLAIFIACMGLLGMIANKVAEKRRELGIRKVLGAGLRNIAAVLLSNTMRQLLIAVLLGIPFSWYLSTQYLERYYERIELSWWLFAAPVACLLVIMMLSISSLLLSVVRNSPIDSIRQE